ncbi:MAG: GNAT family N-acetyltransferase [Anaerolineae bacterium]|nr:GNAT family N-acetyltransferase [Anaerolineae bacterium]
MSPVTTYHVNPSLTNDDLNDLFRVAWPDHTDRDFTPILQHSLVYIGACQDSRLVGFVNVVWDGGIHAFLLDTTVHPQHQRQGVGAALVQHAITESRARRIHWLHVDYEPHLEHFYRSCGFQPTLAGLLRLG